MVSFASDIQGCLDFIQRHCCGGFLERLYESYNEAKEESAVRRLQKKISLFQVQMQLGSSATAPDRGASSSFSIFFPVQRSHVILKWEYWVKGDGVLLSLQGMEQEKCY